MKEKALKKQRLLDIITSFQEEALKKEKAGSIQNNESYFSTVNFTVLLYLPDLTMQK